MERLVLAAAIALVCVVVAWAIQRRRAPAPLRGKWPVPTQIDRQDFPGGDVPWLVVVFTSATCSSCERAVAMARGMASDRVVVEEVELGAGAALHERYGIEAVPTTVVADAEGVVQASFVGPPAADELAAAVSASGS